VGRHCGARERGADNADQRADVALYTMAGTSYPTFYRDVTAGNNAATAPRPRYDFVTGSGARLPTRLSRV